MIKQLNNYLTNWARLDDNLNRDGQLYVKQNFDNQK
jgi:hypothetical protein